jgi:hypothetical protein
MEQSALQGPPAHTSAAPHGVRLPPLPRSEGQRGLWYATLGGEVDGKYRIIHMQQRPDDQQHPPMTKAEVLQRLDVIVRGRRRTTRASSGCAVVTGSVRRLPLRRSRRCWTTPCVTALSQTCSTKSDEQVSLFSGKAPDEALALSTLTVSEVHTVAARFLKGRVLWPDQHQRRIQRVSQDWSDYGIVTLPVDNALLTEAHQLLPD